MLFADPRNVTSLAYRVACRPLTDEEKIQVKRNAQYELDLHKGRPPQMRRRSAKHMEHLRRIVHEPSYLYHIEVHEHVGESWDLPV